MTDVSTHVSKRPKYSLRGYTCPVMLIAVKKLISNVTFRNRIYQDSVRKEDGFVETVEPVNVLGAS